MSLVDAPDPFAWLVTQARQWIITERELHRPHGVPLPYVEKEALRPFIRDDVLGGVRLRALPTLGQPPFLDEAVKLGIPATIDFAAMSGITFIDTVLFNQSRPVRDQRELVFHELVHAVQYAVLGVDEFARQYVEGFVAGGFNYASIPLEVSAYELAARFVSAPTAFSVDAETRARFAPRGSI